MPLTVEDLEKVQAQLTEAQLDYEIELVNGQVIIMGLSDYTSEVIIARLITFLNMWVMPRALGHVTGSGAGFRLPNGDLRGPDVSFVSAKKMPKTPRSFAEIVPDLMVEVRSASDNIKPLANKIKKFIELGTQVGILVDPKNLTVTVYRPTGEPIVLTNEDTLTVAELLPGWELKISEIWPQQFDA
jgi:Uma2 family endonuclease